MKIINAYICQVIDDSIRPVFGNLTIEGNRILQIEEKEIEYLSPSEHDIDARGRVLTIPNINFHEHYYSRLAKGLPISKPMTNFQEILENLWWKLDLLLDEDMLKASVNMGALESIRHGVTYVIDHHASPSYVNGSLKTVADVMYHHGLRGVLCFETSDRNGKEISEQSLQEHIRFAGDVQSDDFKTLLGLHASFTVDEETLKRTKQIIDQYNIGIHIHLCEDKSDVLQTISTLGSTPIERLRNHCLLNEKSILAHGIHLSADDKSIIAESGAAIAHNLHSNLNNAVGLPDFSMPAQIPILLGTDGMHANIPSSHKQYFLQMRNAGLSFDEAFGRFISNYFKQYSFIQDLFPDFTGLKKDERADFIIWDYIPPTPFNSENFWGHYLYAMTESPIRDVVQNGKLLMRNFEIVSNTQKLQDEIKTQGHRLYNEFKPKS
jgi:cytosine/adenosine deaminase-related metal-dependent hydrolase